MIKYIKKIIKKQKLLKKYREEIKDCMFLLNRYHKNSGFYKYVEKDLIKLYSCYNRLRRL